MLIDLKAIIDTMLPGDPELGMPSASEIDFDVYLSQHRIENLANEFIQMLNKVCEEKYGQVFDELDGKIKMQAINSCKLVNVRLFSDLVGHLLKAYYTSPYVLAKIGAGSIPPFPQGNSIEQDDWSILESVYDRGRMYREIS